ncbi:MAC Perforin domain containing protein, putative [Babesia ovis]|uniref:MAC Perforin domain containing protein, putative n=1 Tax=Babesia ovis TaxID=5869 RepID=A0A9W5WTD8_BABOV|nr:MAC Perforin domain containing protein, putative [Babesia ovis]
MTYTVAFQRPRLPAEKSDNTTSLSVYNVKRYIGLGYDAVFGNPFGSFGLSKGSGYRNPILETTLFSNAGNPNDEQLDGSWTRELATCWISDTRDGIDDDELVHDLQNEFKVEGAESNELLNANIKSIVDKQVENKYTTKYRISKSFCAIRESGVVLPYNGTVSSVFAKDVKHLPEITGDEGNCTPDVYVIDQSHKDCGNIHLWIKFFRRYGTHITTRIMIGGQIIYIDRVVKGKSSAKVKNKKTENNGDYNVEDDFNSAMRGARESNQMLVIGGYYFTGLESNDSDAFKKWFKSVWIRPMPIRASFTSLEHFLGDKANSYRYALKFYQNIQNVANGHSLNYHTFSQMLKETVTVVSDIGFANCPKGMVVVVGFVLSNSTPIHIDACVASRSFCSSDVLRKDAIAVALCAKGPGFNIVAFDSKDRRRCPNDQVVAFGFQVFTDESSALQLAACPTGRQDCGMMPGKDGVEWKACIDSKLLDSEYSPRTGGTLNGKYKTIKCPKGQKVVSGFTLRRMGNTLKVDNCTADIETCDIRCSGYECSEGAAYMLCL